MQNSHDYSAVAFRLVRIIFDKQKIYEKRIYEEVISDHPLSVAELNSIYYCFEIRPWSKNVTRSLLKEPKYYLWDWSLCADEGAKAENFVALHLLKAVNFWTDYGFGEYDLHYLRDKEQREVDFIITKNKKPWILVEVKNSEQSLSPALGYFKTMLQAEYAFQVVINMPYVDRNSFEPQISPMVVPAKTFLAQLI